MTSATAARGRQVSEGVTALAYAKVNLTLEVLGRRDDGYHEVVTALQTVSLHDRLTFVADAEISAECSVPSLSSPDNLAWRAAQALKEATGYMGGARIVIEKGIPEAMGLGGGSSDAAAALVALNRLWELGLSVTELEEVGRGLGADVPFLVGGGTALGVGRGDRLTRLRPLPPQWLVIVCPMLRVEEKTRRMYGLLDRESYTDGKVTRVLVDAVERAEFSHQMLYNVFESVAFDVFPGLDRVMRDVEDAGVRHVSLSGSGPALYALVGDEGEGQHIRDRLARLGHRAYLAETRDSSPHLTLGIEEN